MTAMCSVGHEVIRSRMSTVPSSSRASEAWATIGARTPSMPSPTSVGRGNASTSAASWRGSS
jgi:hypothetical protein